MAPDQKACQIIRMLSIENRLCKRCNCMIYFVRINGKPHPFDPNGESHFATCPHAALFRNKKQETKTPGLFDIAEDYRGYPD